MMRTFKLLVSTAGSSGQSARFAVGDALDRLEQHLFAREIVVAAVAGQGRVGKSSLLSYFASSISNQIPFGTFRTSDSIDPVTRDLDALLLELQNGKILLLIDMEGTFNRDRPELDVLLALVSQLTTHLIFMDRTINDTFRTSLGRMVGARLVSMDDNGTIAWPKLHVILNMSRTRVDNTTLAGAFAAGNGVTESTAQELNSAFPPDRRSIAAFPDAGFALDGRSFNELQASPFGQAVDAWLRDVLGQEHFFDSAFCDSATGLPHTLGSYLALMRDIVARTNANMAAGRNVVQLPGGLNGVVTQMSSRAHDAALQAFRDGPGGAVMGGISGTETQSELRSTITGYKEQALVSYDAAMRGLHRFPEYAAKRSELVAWFDEHLARAEAQRSARAQALAEAEQRRIAEEGLRTARAEAERRRQLEAAQRACPAGGVHVYSGSITDITYDHGHVGEWGGYLHGHPCCGKCKHRIPARWNGGCGGICGNPRETGRRTVPVCSQCGQRGRG